MESDALIRHLIDIEILRRSVKGQSLEMVPELFSRWLIDRGITFNQFFGPDDLADAQVSDAAGSDEKKFSVGRKSRVGQDASPDGVPSREWMNRRPSLSTVKNIRLGNGVSPKVLAPVLARMLEFDKGLARLIELNKNAGISAVMQTAVDGLQGFWNEYHFTRQAGVSKIARGLLSILSDSEVYYTIYEPSPAKKENSIRYKGSFQVEIRSIVFRFESEESGLRQGMELRYPYNSLTQTVPNNFSGLGSGINFDGEILATPSVIKRNENHGIPTRARKFPRDFSIPDDEASLWTMRDIPDFFEYGPFRSIIHQKQPNQILADDIRNLGEDETVDIITTYSTDYWDFERVIKNFADDKNRLRKFRCIFLDPDCSAFKLRFALSTKVSSSDLKDQVNRLEQYAARGKGETGVSFSIRYTPYWPMGIACRVGNSSLHFGTLFATQDALTAPIIECRDFESSAFSNFRSDFERIWEKLSSPNPSGDDLLGGLLLK